MHFSGWRGQGGYSQSMKSSKPILILGALLLGLALYTHTLNRKVEQLSNLEPVQVTDTVTLTDWQYDTVYQTNTKVETLRLLDTLYTKDTDTLYAQVEVPISRYVWDTLISTDSSQTQIRAVCEGFSVELDTLSIQWLKVAQTPCLGPQQPSKWYERICPAVGVGYGTGGFGVFVGVGWTL